MKKYEMDASGDSLKGQQVADEIKITFRKLFSERDTESTFILFIVPILLTLWVYYGKQTDFDALFKGLQGRWNQDIYSTIYEYLSAFLLMFWIPYFFVKVGFRKGLKDFGFKLGDWRYGMRFVMIAAPFLLWAAYTGAAQPGIQAEYPLARSMIGHWRLFLLVECFYIVYYVSWEFMFRGFMLFGLERKFGALPAILIQTIPSAIVHIGKPASESFGAIAAGLAFGYLAIRSRSIIYPLILHIIVGIATDIFVSIRLS
ncbi:CPBP family intramembrane metalloprotease [bacterium]|nr:CPBP family intramembrane metalloprotease [bacterium]